MSPIRRFGEWERLIDTVYANIAVIGLSGYAFLNPHADETCVHASSDLYRSHCTSPFRFSRRSSVTELEQAVLTVNVHL